MLADPKSLHSDLGVQTWRAEDDYEGHILLQEDIVNLWKQGEDKMNWFEVVSYIEISNLQMRIMNAATLPFLQKWECSHPPISAEVLLKS